MSAPQESAAAQLYRAACAGDVTSKVLLANQLCDLAPTDTAILFRAELWFREVMQEQEVTGAYGVASVRLRRGTNAYNAGTLGEAIHHYGATLALLDGIADDPTADPVAEQAAARLLSETLASIRLRGLEDVAIAEAKAIRAQANANGY